MLRDARVVARWEVAWTTNVCRYVLQATPDALSGLAYDGGQVYSWTVLALGICAGAVAGSGGAPKGATECWCSLRIRSFRRPPILSSAHARLVSVHIGPNVSGDELPHVIQTTEGTPLGFTAAANASKQNACSEMRVFTETDLPAITGGTTEDFRSSVPPHETDASNLAALMFTSGLTESRCVMVSHENICEHRLSHTLLDLKEIEHILAVLPFQYCFGTSLLRTRKLHSDGGILFFFFSPLPSGCPVQRWSHCQGGEQQVS